MRELGLAIVGAAALIVLGVWGLGRNDNSEWADATKVNHKSGSLSAVSAGAAGATIQSSVTAPADSVGFAPAGDR